MTLKLNGSTDGSVSIDAPADTSPTGSDITLTLPTTVGSANQFVKNGGTAGELEYSSMVEDSSGNLGLGGITSPTWASDGGIHLGDDYGIGFGDGGSGRPDFQVITAGDGRLDLRCGFGADDPDISIDSSGRIGVNNTSPGSYYANQLVVDTGSSAQSGITIVSDSSNQGMFAFADGTSGSDRFRGFLNYNHSNDSLAFGTDGNERVRIRSQGEADFTSSSHVLSATTSDGASTSTYLYRGHHSNGSTICFNVWSNGNVENTNNSYGQISDSKLKENIVDASSQWDNIKDLRVRNFNFIEGQTHTQIGVIAQEVETVSPGLVSETPDFDEDGNDLGTVTKSVKYSVLYMKAVKALQEAQTRIETLETQNTAQQAQIDDLLARVTALEAAE